MESTASLPNRLCNYCISKILDIIQFIQLCKDADRKWRDMIEHLTLPSTLKHSVHVLVSSDCQKRELLNCSKNKIKDSKEALKLLKKRLIKNKYSKRNEKEKRMKLANNMSCPECEKAFYNIGDFNKHLKILKKKMCPHCSNILDLEAYKSHAETHNSNVYSCDICHECFVHRNSFLMHKSKHSSRGKHICHECKLSFSNIHKLSLHLVKHEHCVCSTCKKTFTNKSCFRNHKKVCADKECICDYCNKTFAGKNSVAAHIQIVHMKNTYKPCGYCGKSYAAADMIEHMKQHESNESYTCEYCGIVLKTKLGLSQHLRLHTGEKPYACKFCGKTFLAASRRSEHTRKMHNSSEVVLKHACEFCPARFKRPYRLQKHMTSVHGDGDEPSVHFECPECHAKFSSRQGLLNHKRIHQQSAFPEIVERKIVLEEIL